MSRPVVPDVLVEEGARARAQVAGRHFDERAKPAISLPSPHTNHQELRLAIPRETNKNPNSRLVKADAPRPL